MPEEKQGKSFVSTIDYWEKKASANSESNFFFSQRAKMMFLRVVECLIFFFHPLVARKVVFY